MTSPSARVMTSEELLATPGLGRCELVEGELVMMSPAGEEHGSIVMNLSVCLGQFVRRHRLGRAYGGETGFVIRRNPDTVRAPDLSFVRSERLGERPGRKFFEGPPDLAVEVLSPGDRAGEVLAKVDEWLEAGCRAVWVVDPETRTVGVYRSRSRIARVGVSEQLDGEEVVPGFTMPVAEVFA